MAQEGFEILGGLEDSYDQIQKVAIGGMAEVYRGRQKLLDRPVAIKRIRAELRPIRDIQERFRREARSSANLLHQNLAHVYDYRVVGDDAFIIMEYIGGWDLAEILEKVGAVPPDVAAMIGAKMLAGLSYVHTHGLVHRDIKPDNVRVSLRGEIKIMDFGIAFDPGETGNLTQPGILIGSPHYLSPEQVVGGKLDTRADLFAFGITLYEMLTGKKPFFETPQESVYARIQRGAYIAPEKIKPDIPPLLAKLIADCLQTLPQKRPASAQVVEAALRDYAASQFAASFESRIRKFLMEARLVSGNPSLIEVEEKTLPPVKTRLERWKPFLKFTATLALGIAIGAAAAGFLAKASAPSWWESARGWLETRSQPKEEAP